MSDEHPVVFTDDNPEWTEEDFARARPAAEVLGAEVAALFVRQPGKTFMPPRPIARRRTPRIPVSAEVIEALRASGPGWQTRADAILRKVLLG